MSVPAAEFERVIREIDNLSVAAFKEIAKYVATHLLEGRAENIDEDDVAEALDAWMSVTQSEMYSDPSFVPEHKRTESRQPKIPKRQTVIMGRPCEGAEGTRG